MKSVYQTQSYREALNRQIEIWKVASPSNTLTRLAGSVGIQLSYLSNALKERAQLSSDQLYLITRELGFEETETDYLLLLLERERTAVKERQAEFDRRIREIQSEQLGTKKNLKARNPTLEKKDLETYFLDPFMQLLHLAISMRAGATSSALSHQFGLPEVHVAKILTFLERVGYVKRKGHGFSAETPSLHLAKDSPIAGPYLLLMRMKALDQLQRLTPSQKYSFSVTMTISHETRLKIEREFTKFLEAAEKLTAGSKPEALYQLNFDLFPWEVFSARGRET